MCFVELLLFIFHALGVDIGLVHHLHDLNHEQVGRLVGHANLQYCVHENLRGGEWGKRLSNSTIKKMRKKIKLPTRITLLK